MQFHTSFVAGTHNSRLMRIYDTLAAETRMCIHHLRVTYPRVDVLVREHQEILDMLELRDNEGLQRAISNHMRKAVDDLTATTQQDRADRVGSL
jgi:DNA-binding GntR family transcriptional regulator